MEQKSYLSTVIEPGPGVASGLKDLKSHTSVGTISAGIVAAIFGCSGPALLVMKAATDGGLTPEQAISWLFGIYVL
ncbi:MAG: benzoate/H(+) symporter BenE family transporter, partial [Candidatus Adiutrix sp.]|nr:benzoate/H(+) symporter BenE family transporter [Candidatus Adiutrix sp.]